NRKIELELMNIIQKNRQINRLISDCNNTNLSEALSILAPRQSFRSLGDYEISNEDAINFISMSRSVEEGMNIFILPEDLELDGLIGISPIINQYGRVRISDEVFRSTFSKWHKNSSRILVKFAEDRDVIIYLSQYKKIEEKLRYQLSISKNDDKLSDDNLEYYHNSDFETMHVDWEQDILSESSRISPHLSATTKTLSSTQTVLEIKRKEYFDKITNDMSEEIRVCKVIDESKQKCKQEYINVRSSTGNLIMHLRDEYGIVSTNDLADLKRPLSTVTDNIYKKKMAEFDPSFVVLDFWSSRAEYGYLEITMTWIMSNFEINDVMLENKYIPSPHTNKVIANELRSSLFFKYAITQLQTDLYISVDREIKKDASETLSNNELFSDEDTIFESDATEIQYIDLDNDKIISNITKKRISIKNLLNIIGILEEVKKNIYDALIYYWNVLNELSLIATLLDTQYKNLDFLYDDIEKEQTIQKLHNEFGEMKEVIFESNKLPPPNIEAST
ncbi:9313_t:CDS:10, partial [Scutellospora calospora]